jgi:hypothetical protein
VFVHELFNYVNCFEHHFRKSNPYNIVPIAAGAITAMVINSNGAV